VVKLGRPVEWKFIVVLQNKGWPDDDKTCKSGTGWSIKHFIEVFNGGTGWRTGSLHPFAKMLTVRHVI